MEGELINLEELMFCDNCEKEIVDGIILPFKSPDGEIFACKECAESYFALFE